MSPRPMLQKLPTLALALTMATLGAASAVAGDVREFTVGLSVDQLPDTGYLGFTCGGHEGEEGQAIADWGSFRDCPPGPQGLREVFFRYDDSGVISEDFEGTMVAGHPVLISLLIGDDGIVEGLRVASDPGARDYHRRRARMLSGMVKTRFGFTGWRCVNTPAGDGEFEIGGLYINERCEKDLGGRRIVLLSQFFRSYGATGESTVSAAQFEIRRQ